MVALQSGTSALDFWDMTYGEVADTIKAHAKEKEIKLKEQAIMNYKLADLIATNVGAMLSKDAKAPTLIEAYEFLFKEEKEYYAEISAKNEMEAWKQRMIAFAENHNRKWGENK